MYCPRCGSPNAEAARFCEKCATALGAPSAAPARPPEMGPTALAQPPTPYFALRDGGLPICPPRLKQH
jgi:hypothetical protein